MLLWGGGSEYGMRTGAVHLCTVLCKSAGRFLSSPRMWGCSDDAQAPNGPFNLLPTHAGYRF